MPLFVVPSGVRGLVRVVTNIKGGYSAVGFYNASAVRNAEVCSETVVVRLRAQSAGHIAAGKRASCSLVR